MKSMTGHGHGECARDGYKVCAELSSVNRKQLEVTVYLPRELDVLEAQAREAINRALSRGKVNARVTLHLTEAEGPSKLRLNHTLARAYVRELTKLAKELDLAGPISLELVARAPGVMESGLDTPDAEAYWPTVQAALQTALAELVRTREREGSHLAADLAKRIQIMRKAAARVSKRAPLVQKRYRQQIIERLQEAGLAVPAEGDERLLKEVVLFADRSDISEELARLESHFQQFDDCRKSAEPMGRMLDFLAQEMNREINTIGSKANDAAIAQEVVILKTELEKFREQAMNVE
jgi:uncharacterized protein (TIGR00255 family)